MLVGGSTDPQSIVASSSDPDVQSRKLLLEAQLLQKWGSIFKEVGPKDPLRFVVLQEMFKRLERVVDRFEDVANEIDGLVIDHS